MCDVIKKHHQRCSIQTQDVVKCGLGVGKPCLLGALQGKQPSLSFQGRLAGVVSTAVSIHLSEKHGFRSNIVKPTKKGLQGMGNWLPVTPVTLGLVDTVSWSELPRLPLSGH